MSTLCVKLVSQETISGGRSLELPESTTVAGTVGTVILRLCMHHVQAALLTSAPLQQ